MLQRTSTEVITIEPPQSLKGCHAGPGNGIVSGDRAAKTSFQEPSSGLQNDFLQLGCLAILTAFSFGFAHII